MPALGSIRKQLAALVLAPFLAALGIGVATAWSTWTDRLEAEEAANLEIARATASAFKAYVDGVLQESASLGTAIVAVQDEQGIDRLLEEAARGRPSIRSLSWVSPEGFVLASSDGERVGSSVAASEPFQIIARGGEWGVGELVPAGPGGEPAFDIVQATYGRGGRLVGAVVATIDAVRLDVRALRLERVGRAGVGIADRNGRMAFRSPHIDLPWERRDVSRDPIIAAALSGREAAGPTRSLSTGEPWIGAAVPVEPFGWVARAGRSREEVLSPVRSDVARAAVWGALVLAVALGASALLGRRIVLGLERLERHAERLGRGETPRRGVEGQQELERLGRAFDEMAGRILAANDALAVNALFFETSPDLLAVVDRECRIRLVNEAYATAVGRGREDIVGRTIGDIFGHEHFEGVVRSRIERAMAGERVQYETWRDLPRRGRRLLDITYHPMRGARGDVEFVGIRLRDETERAASVAERERLAAAVDRQRILFERVFRESPAGIAVLDGGTLRVRWANARFRSFLDPPFDEGIDGLPIDAFLPEAGESGLVEIFERAARDGVPYDDPELRIDGFARGTAWFRWSLRPIPGEGARPDLLLLVTEVTEEVLARREAQRAQRVREAILEAGGVLATTLEPDEVADRVAHAATPRVADWCWIDRQEPDGTVRPMALAHADAAAAPDGREPGRAAPPIGRFAIAARVIETRAPVLIADVGDADLAAMARDAEHLDALKAAGFRSWLAVPLVARGEVLGALTLAMALSGRRFGPEDVPVAEALAHQAAQAIDSARLFAATQRAVRHRDEVLAVVSHDLRTPLATVVMGASAIAATVERGELVPEKLAGTANRIRTAGERMGRMVNDLLDLSTLEEGRLALAPTEVAPADLLRELADQARPLAEGKGLEFGWDAAADLPRVRCDAGRVLQVLSNLVSNAIKAAEAGFVLVRAGASGADVRFEVADSGPGISEADLPHIFDRFRRGRDAGYRGTGLGLAIARGIVEAHGGRIWAESRLGAGTRVFFTLPASAAPSAKAAR